MIRKLVFSVLPVIAAGLLAAAPAPLSAQLPDAGMMMDDPPGPFHGPMGRMGGYGQGRGMGMMGHGMMGMGHGMMGGGLGAFGMLDLSDEQRTKVNKIFDAERRQHWVIGGKLLDERIKLRDLLYADEPDPKKVGAVYGEIAKLRQQTIEAHVQAANQARAVLTAEQRDRLKQWRRGMMMGGQGMGAPGPGGRGPMGPGNMPGGMMGQ
ncbi:MAG: Spy/CpxP family protein refolding chaperone [Gammaproteobacteria bacterium]|nr:Spy/CpxP family protein refolding chaperone [Gammaproteobacteria bacterium]